MAREPRLSAYIVRVGGRGPLGRGAVPSADPLSTLVTQPERAHVWRPDLSRLKRAHVTGDLASVLSRGTPSIGDLLAERVDPRLSQIARPGRERQPPPTAGRAAVPA